MSTASFVVLHGEVHDIPPSKLSALRDLVEIVERKLRHGDILCHHRGEVATIRLVIQAQGGLIVFGSLEGSVIYQPLSYYLGNPDWKVIGNVFKDQWDIIECFE